ncbi:MAG: hypothetical protein LC808_28475 [Actinobacteria bacterium]|nr:hypothetical protein [Actinomycetota bacterium]
MYNASALGRPGRGKCFLSAEALADLCRPRLATRVEDENGPALAKKRKDIQGDGSQNLVG